MSSSKASTPDSLLRLFVQFPERISDVVDRRHRLPFLRSDHLGPRHQRLTDRHLDMYTEALSAHEVWHGMLEAGRAIADWRLPVEALRSAGIPAQVLWGEKDPLVPLLQGEHLATSLKAQFTVLAKTGHCVPEERPEAILKALG